jgi:hypothetical protein
VLEGSTTTSVENQNQKGSTIMTIKTTYKGIVITYVDHDDVFEFVLRGMSCTAKTIGEARKRIDEPPPKEKKPFTRFKAYYSEYNERFDDCEVTSLVERRSMHCSSEVWIVVKEGKRFSGRRKVYERDIYPSNAHNDKIVTEVRRLQDNIETIQKSIAKLKDEAEVFERKAVPTAAITL